MDDNLNETPRDQSQTNRPITQNKVPKDQVVYQQPNPNLNQPNQYQYQVVQGVPPSHPQPLQIQSPQHANLKQPMLVQVAINNQSSQISCPSCGSVNILTQLRSGCTTISWCVCLFFFTGLCCWIPFVMDSCHDTEIICARCGFLINSIPAPCC